MSKAISHADYPAFVAGLKERILYARTLAARAVNRELVLLYWDIGRSIVEKQQTAGWGDAVVERLAADLHIAFPDMKGFSLANLWRMKQFFLVHASPDFLAQAVRETGAGKASPARLAFAVKTKVNPIGVAEYQLQARLPAAFKGKLPTGRQLADAVRVSIPLGK